MISVKFCDVFLNQSHTVIEQPIFQQYVEILRGQQAKIDQSRIIISNLKTFFLKFFILFKVKYLINKDGKFVFFS